jgi:hypothetical protein
LQGTGGSRCEPKYSHNSDLKGSLKFGGGGVVPESQAATGPALS